VINSFTVERNVPGSGMGFKSFDAGQGKRFPKISKSFVTAPVLQNPNYYIRIFGKIPP
jgi:hypothetical protein